MLENSAPLAERMRPSTLDDIVGQPHLAGPDGILRKMLKQKQVPSMIFWGPPGVGKTTLANVIANQGGYPFHVLSAISAGVKDVREVIQGASRSGKAILFIDEIHRFNKSQQDALLGAVEKGLVTLIGATTENPSFEVNAALLSRCQVYSLRPLERKDLIDLLHKAMEKDYSLKSRKITIQEEEALLQLSGGDARRLLNLFELAVQAQTKDPAVITNEGVTAIAQQRIARYDKGREQHYDIISAFIKSIRGSDPNAGIYWLARMLEGGEDIKFIARRLLILASEDIGQANPTALVVANSTFQAVNVIGMPEAEIILSQCVTYLACSPKSNASYLAIKKARQLVRETGDLPVPMAIRNAPTKLMKDEGYGKGYQYAHDFPNHFVPMEFLPQEIKGQILYEPAQNPREEEFRKRLQFFWKDYYKY